MKIALLVVGLLSLAGCASSSGVVPMGQDTYMISRSAGYGHSATGPVKIAALQEANEYCAKNGKEFQIVHTQETPMSFGHFPEAEIQFMCLNQGDPELTRPKMISDQAPVRQISSPVQPAVVVMPPSTFTPVQPYQMKTPAQTNCTSNKIGNQVSTNCSGN